MKIACLQFAPKLGKVAENIRHAEQILNSTNLHRIDLLVLPEMAFSGYNHPSLPSITPYLEPTSSGISTYWAQATARRLTCHVTIGYPEITLDDPPRRYNSTVTVGPDGSVLAHYRKSFLYYTDETWAEEGEGFFVGEVGGLGRVAMGICMDVNPYQFTAPWTKYEFANHALTAKVPLVVLSMAWLSRLTADELAVNPDKTDMETLFYWVGRFQPLIESDTTEPVVIVLANRCGVEDDACYAGSSAVICVQSGQVTIHDMLGKGEEKVLIVETNEPGKYTLQTRAPDAG